MSDEIVTRVKVTKKQIDEATKKQNIQSLDGSELFLPEWINLENVEAKSQPWFWAGIIPLETLTLFAGFGGIGKSLLLLYIIAHTTNGKEFNAGGSVHKLPQGSVILLSAEDDVETQVKPKLLAFGADLSKVHFIKFKISSKSSQKKFLELDKDLHILREKLEQEGDVRLVIYDPITYFLGNVRDHINTEVANFLQLQIDLAKEFNLGLILNKHLRKQASTGKGGGSAQDEVAGSGAWINSPRKCWLISDWHEDKNIKVLTNLKDNLGKKSEECLAYKIETTVVKGADRQDIETVKLTWLDKLISFTSKDAVATEEQYSKSKQDKCVEFIANYIKEYGQSRGDAIRDEAVKKGYSLRTFERAMKDFKAAYEDVLKIEAGISNQKTYRFI